MCEEGHGAPHQTRAQPPPSLAALILSATCKALQNKSAGPSPSGEAARAELFSSLSPGTARSAPGNADGWLAAFSPSALREDESHSDQNAPSRPRSGVVGERAAGSHGGFLPSLC